MDEYSTIYSKLQSNKKYGVTTLDGQVEDIDLKEKNQMLQLGIWGSLAVLLVLVTLDKLKNNFINYYIYKCFNHQNIQQI